ncbi:MAG TPA: type II toxin-antitoxin system YafQ family toxin [Beijerinckiaceae bacterium]|jgi:mRNA interferase YafQ
MASKDAGDRKRATIPLRCDYTRDFEKDWERLKKAGRFDLAAAKAAMFSIMADDGPLPASYRDHALKGRLSAYRELHVGGDFLLMYRVEARTVVFVRLGTHADLFED